jgi:hypothetical protein
MTNLRDLIPQVLAEMEARKLAVQAKTEQMSLFNNVYDLYDEERAELIRIFSDFEISLERKTA